MQGSTISTQFSPFTTKNMGATGAIKISRNSEEVRPKSPGDNRLDGARLSICMHASVVGWIRSGLRVYEWG